MVLMYLYNMKTMYTFISKFAKDLQVSFSYHLCSSSSSLWPLLLLLTTLQFHMSPFHIKNGLCYTKTRSEVLDRHRFVNDIWHMVITSLLLIQHDNTHMLLYCTSSILYSHFLELHGNSCHITYYSSMSF